MKYEVSTFHGEEEISVEVSCRSDASMRTVFRKCADGIFQELYKNGLIPGTVQYQYDLPNIWRNGAIGSLWICDPYYPITITRDDGKLTIAF